MATLAVIAVPSYQDSVTKSHIKEAQTNLVALSLTAENRYQRALKYPVYDLTSTAQIKAQAEFSTWNPTSNSFTYAYKSTDGSDFLLTATGTGSNVSGCTLTINNVGTKTVSGCSVPTGWTN